MTKETKQIIMIAVMLAAVLLVSADIVWAKEIGNIYDPSTGQTTYINQDSRGNVDLYDPNMAKTIYINNY